MTKARDLANAGTALTTVSATELGYLDGVTSAVQTQLNTKQAVVSGVDNTEIGYLDGVTSAIQTQLDAKIAKSVATTKGDILVATGSATVVRQGVGTDGQVLTADSAEADGVKWATPVSGAITWTQRTNPASNTGVNNMHHNGSLWVAVGVAGTIRTSSDGITWTSRTSGTTNALYAVSYGNSLWVVVGDGGVIRTSSDGITWTSRTSGTSQVLYNVKYLNSLWIAMGAGAVDGLGGITTSTDGLTWTLRTTTASTSAVNVVLDCYYDNGYFVATGEPYSTNESYYSTNGTTWTAFQGGVGNGYTAVYYTGSYWLLLGTATVPTRYVASVPTGTWATWTIDISLPLLPSTGVNSNSYFREYNGKMYSAQKISTATSQWTINSWSKETTGIFVTSFYSPIDNLPAYPAGNNYYRLNMYTFALSSTGQPVIADNAGRIWTSF